MRKFQFIGKSQRTKNRNLTKEKRVKKRHQFVLILGIINVILPVIPVLSHRGWFGMVENGWKFIWVATIMILLPFVSSLAGIIIGSNLFTKKIYC